MKNRYILFLFILMVVSNILLIVKFVSITIDYQDLKQNEEAVKVNMKSYIDKITNKEMLEMKSEQSSLPEKIINLISPKGKGTLVLRLSEEDCFNCYNEVFYIIKTRILELRNEKIFILGNFKDKQSLGGFVNENIKKNVRIYNYTDSLMLPIERLHVPYAFLLSSEGQIKNVYSFDRNNTEVLELYIDNVVKKITKQ